MLTGRRFVQWRAALMELAVQDLKMKDATEVIEYDGRIVSYGLLSGSKVEDPNFLKKLLFKRAALLPSTLRARDTDYKAALLEALQTDPDAFPAISREEITVEVAAVFPMDEVRAAHAMMAANSNAGKIVLEVSSVLASPAPEL